ncbi:hypothetical protein HAX54_049181 [Datura stramonium]|uniref:DUF7086 domain-containing protein n=1 Tax=Datura stramonium TaxID=4076 RepID=A0ABS8WK96_DATST|nr:hypothetical protein [Datura stramonium]
MSRNSVRFDTVVWNELNSPERVVLFFLTWVSGEKAKKVVKTFIVSNEKPLNYKIISNTPSITSLVSFFFSFMNNQNNEEEINRKRKNFSTHEDDDDEELLTLSLMSFRPPTRPRISDLPPPLSSLPPPSLPPPPLPQTPMSPYLLPPPVTLLEAVPTQSMRKRRNSSSKAGAGNKEERSETVTPPFAWSTNRRATVHTLDYLFSKQLFKISGDVQCKRCERKYQIEFDLKEKFLEIGTYIAENKSAMHDRAPDIWMNPLLPTCQFCKQENSVKPIVSEDKNNINWLFLLLGRMLGCCTLEDLKYFCEHTKNHRTGAKDRVLYLTYLTLCKQLDPNGPFNR